MAKTTVEKIQGGQQTTTPCRGDDFDLLRVTPFFRRGHRWPTGGRGWQWRETTALWAGGGPLMDIPHRFLVRVIRIQMWDHSCHESIQFLGNLFLRALRMCACHEIGHVGAGARVTHHLQTQCIHLHGGMVVDQFQILNRRKPGEEGGFVMFSSVQDLIPSRTRMYWKFSRNKQNVPAPKIGRGVFQGHCRHPMR